MMLVEAGHLVFDIRDDCDKVYVRVMGGTNGTVGTIMRRPEARAIMGALSKAIAGGVVFSHDVADAEKRRGKRRAKPRKK